MGNTKVKLYSVFITLFVMICAIPASSVADTITADLVQISTPVYHPTSGVFKPRTGIFEYEVSWQGIPAATAKVQIEQEGLRYKITTFASPLNKTPKGGTAYPL